MAELNPVHVKLGKEELILAGLRPGEIWLSHQGGKNEEVEIFFDQAILAPATQRLLRSQAWAQSQQPRRISYTTLATEKVEGSPCRTYVTVKPADATLSELRLFQNDIAGLESHRELSLGAAGRLQVDFKTEAFDPAVTKQPDCRKLLQVGDDQIALSGIPMSILLQAGGAAEFKFMPASLSPIWEGKEGFFEPFPGAGLEVRSARVSPMGSAQKVFEAVAGKGANGLIIDRLEAGSNQLEMRLSGVGLITVNDRPVSATLAEWVSASGGRASLLGLANLLMLCGAVAFGLRRARRTGGDPVILDPLLPIRVPSGEGLIVFLCHCSEDKAVVREIDRMLKADGFRPWFDEADIPPAAEWDDEIQRALRMSDAVVVCLSKTFSRKEGYVQKELRAAMELALEKLDGAKFLIPVRLEECDVLPGLKKYQYIDWFQPEGHEKLMLALRERARQLEMAAASKSATA